MPTFPNVNPTLTVSALLKQPTFISRRLSDVKLNRYVADLIFQKGSSDQVSSGTVAFQRSESIFLDRDIEEVGVRSLFPRTSWSETVLTANVRQYGIEIPINDIAIRRNQMDQVQRGLAKMANNMVRWIDGKAMTLITTDSAVQTMAGSGDWTTAATDIIKDIVAAQLLIRTTNQGYNPDTLVVNDAQYVDLLNDTDIRGAMARETTANPVYTGSLGSLLGMQIVATPNLTAGTALVMDSQMAGTIADESPTEGGYSSYSSGGFAPVYTKVYREEGTSDTIIRGVRWTAMWLAEPTAVVKVTGI